MLSYCGSPHGNERMGWGGIDCCEGTGAFLERLELERKACSAGGAGTEGAYVGGAATREKRLLGVLCRRAQE